MFDCVCDVCVMYAYMHMHRQSDRMLPFIYHLRSFNTLSKQVLDTHAYEARQKEYALKAHRHFYFMTLNGSEVCIFLDLYLPFPSDVSSVNL